jgi:hypothetical protein
MMANEQTGDSCRTESSNQGGLKNLDYNMFIQLIKGHPADQVNTSPNQTIFFSGLLKCGDPNTTMRQCHIDNLTELPSIEQFHNRVWI